MDWDFGLFLANCDAISIPWSSYKLFEIMYEYKLTYWAAWKTFYSV